MQFFLTEILARVVAAYLAYDCGKQVWSGLTTRTISSYKPDVLDWFLD